MRSLVLLLLLLAWPTAAEPLRVAVGGSVPYVIRHPGRPEGICVRVWELVAQQQHFESLYSVFPSDDAALEELRAGRADVVVGPITMTTRRISEFNLSVPYFVSRLGLLSRARTRTLLERARPFLSSAFMLAVGTLVCLVGSVGMLVWLAERRANPHMFPPRHPGLLNGIWFALATMTGVGYGDVVPTTLPGRLVAVIWMIVTTLFLSTVTAGIVAAIALAHLPAAEIDSLRSIGNARVAVVVGSEAEHLLPRLGIHPYRAPNVSDAVNLLERKEVDVVISSQASLDYTMRLEHRDSEFFLAPATDELTFYCFATRKSDDQLADRVDRELVHLNETDQLHSAYDRWLGSVGR